jgi:hypothetical protein
MRRTIILFLPRIRFRRARAQCNGARNRIEAIMTE